MFLPITKRSMASCRANFRFLDRDTKKLPEFALRESEKSADVWDQAGTMWTFTVTGCTRLPLMPQIVIGTVVFAAYRFAFSESVRVPL